jgi:hypothetical protein
MVFFIEDTRIVFIGIGLLSNGLGKQGKASVIQCKIDTNRDTSSTETMSIHFLWLKRVVLPMPG